MKTSELISIALLGACLAVPVSAQQPASASTADLSPTPSSPLLKDPGNPDLTVSVSIRIVDARGNPVQLPVNQQDLAQALQQVEAPLFTFENGAAYVSFDGGKTKLPVSGGGASGCLTLNLGDRAKAIDALVQKLGETKPTP